MNPETELLHFQFSQKIQIFIEICNFFTKIEILHKN